LKYEDNGAKALLLLRRFFIREKLVKFVAFFATFEPKITSLKHEND
jgi:hypothetical protein